MPHAWLSYPRPVLEGTMPIPVAVAPAAASYYHGSRGGQLPKDGPRWIYENGLRGPGKIVIHLSPSDQLSATLVDHPIVIDGKIDAGLNSAAGGSLAMKLVAPKNAAAADAVEDSDADGSAPAAPAASAKVSSAPADIVAPAKAQAGPAKGKRKGKGNGKTAAKPANPANQPASSGLTATLMLRCDAQALYVIVRSPASRLFEGRPQWLAGTRGEDAPIWNDDSWEVFLTDKSKNTVVQLGVSASGARFDGLWKKGAAAVDPSWNGPWKSAVTTSDQEMVAEMAIPWSMLNQLGIDVHALRINGEGCTPSGWRYDIASQDALRSGPCNTFVTLLNPLDTAPEARKYTVRLHFAEPDNFQPGQRLFGVKLQGQDVLKNFDICKEAGDSHKPLVKEFKGVSPVEAQLELEMTPGLVDGKICGQPPIISAMEAAEEK